MRMSTLGLGVDVTGRMIRLWHENEQAGVRSRRYWYDDKAVA